MSDYLPVLWATLKGSKILESVLEVVIVNDGSTDATREVLQNLTHGESGSKLKTIHLPQNLGRYLARFRGAEVANGELLLFLDTRVQPNKNFGTNLLRLTRSHRAIMGGVDLDESQSVYSLYWKRTHEFMFKRYFRDIQNGFHLTPENYEEYVKGTTVFVCPKDSFLNACATFKDRILHSDDTFLMREIVKTDPIWVDRGLSVLFEPRQQLGPFLARLWERGPKFAEYHIFERRGFYFFLFTVWLIGYLCILSSIIIAPKIGLTLFGLGLLALALSTLLFSRNLVEFLRMAWLHVLAIHSYAFGAVWGVLVLLGLVRKPKPTAATK